MILRPLNIWWNNPESQFSFTLDVAVIPPNTDFSFLNSRSENSASFLLINAFNDNILFGFWEKCRH